MKHYRVVVERTRQASTMREIRDVNDVASLMEVFRVMLREAAASGTCCGFTVTVHAQTDGGCDHEL